MPYTNYVSTEAGADAFAASTGYMEYGSDKTNTVGSFPFRVDQAGNVTAASILAAGGSVVNVKAPVYGATGNGTTDDTAAFQAALNALATNGGVLYIPTGTYKITSTLAWTSTKSLLIRGDGEDSTQINRASATAPFHTFDIQNVAGGVTVQDLLIQNTVNAGAFTDDQVGLYFSGCNRVRLQNVHTASSGNRVNIAVQFNSVNTASIIACDLRGYVNSIYITGTTALVDVVATTLSGNSGSGVATSGVVCMNVTGATLHLDGVETNGGDHGLVLMGGSGANPAFVFANDFEVNNPAGHGIVLTTGAEVWLNQAWLSDQSVAYGTGAFDAIHVGSGFLGWLVVSDCTFQHWGGAGINIGGGADYWISNSSFSGCCGNASNTYDDITVAAAVSNITITGCHFDVEQFNTMQTPRSGVNIASGVTNYKIAENIFAASGYGTAACIDGNAIPQRKGFTDNIHGFDYKDSVSAQTLSTISNAETAICSLPIDPNDLLSGATFRFKILGQYTNGSTSATNNIRLRAGTAGTTSDTQVCILGNTSNSSTNTSANIWIEGTIQLQTPGASGTGKGFVLVTMGGAGYSASGTTFVTANASSWNTTTSTFLTLTFGTNNALNTLVVTMATLEKVT